MVRLFGCVQAYVLLLTFGLTESHPRQDSTISIRCVEPAQPERDPAAWRYCFGNGSARGVAAMTVWMLAQKLLSNSTGDPDVELRSWLLSFFKIPTIHERYGDGSSRATIVHTIARQEQDVAVDGGLYNRLDHHHPQ